jgi:hypothetical protein
VSVIVLYTDSFATTVMAVGLTISVSFSIYLSKKNRNCDCDYTIRGQPSSEFFLFTSQSTASALQRTELHTGTFVACANCDQCHIPDLDYGSALLGSPSGSRALAQRPHNALARLPLALIALPLFLRTSYSNRMSTGRSIL